MVGKTVSKILSANDTGDTGAHQAGILVPKEKQLLTFFPQLEESEYNPRAVIQFHDESGGMWEFAFIYYNNRLHQRGTRNEYRLTRMTGFIRECGLRPGDEVIMTRSPSGEYQVSYRRQGSIGTPPRHTLKLGTGWRVIDI